MKYRGRGIILHFEVQVKLQEAWEQREYERERDLQRRQLSPDNQGYEEVPTRSSKREMKMTLKILFR